MIEVPPNSTRESTMTRILQFHCCFLLTAFFTFAVSVSADEPKQRTLEQSLDLAGKNRAEIQSAIDQCKSELEQKSIKFLVQHMPTQDLESLSAKFLVANVKTAIEARMSNDWARKVPEEIFLNDVLPYASINERRDSWRKDFYGRFKELVKDCNSTGHAAQELNKNVFGILKVRYSTKRKKPDQSPYESMESGLASCTGLSVILVDACRSVGVPARLAGTPLWVNKRGNHTWVEIWDEGQWKFTGACEYDAQGLNRGWFKGIASQANPNDPLHRIYATSFRNTGGHFPMVWKRRSTEVPGVDVTWKYIGKPKPTETNTFTVAFQLVDESRKRVTGKISIEQSGKIVSTGNSRGESNDANDFFELDLEPGKYTVKYECHGSSGEKEIQVNNQENQVHRILVSAKE